MLCRLPYALFTVWCSRPCRRLRAPGRAPCPRQPLRAVQHAACIACCAPGQAGKLGEAEELFKTALEIRERLLGGLHLDTAASLSDMTLLLLDQVIRYLYV
jgi:hypothetical protein